MVSCKVGTTKQKMARSHSTREATLTQNEPSLTSVGHVGGPEDVFADRKCFTTCQNLSIFSYSWTNEPVKIHEAVDWFALLPEMLYCYMKQGIAQSYRTRIVVN